MEIASVILLGIAIVLILRREPTYRTDAVLLRQELTQKLEVIRSSFESQIASFRQELAGRMDSVNRDVGERLTSTTGVLGQVQKDLGALSEAAKQIQEMGKEMTMLQNILLSPKSRGSLGELLLEHLLEDSLPKEHYASQHRFQDGKIVDAVIRLQDGLIPIDSKFPLDNYIKLVNVEAESERKRLRSRFLSDLTGHVDSVASYIRPDEGTLELALMYIPSEGIYYELFVREGDSDGLDIHEYCRNKRVMPVSPSSFYAYLTAIAMGLRGLRIEQTTKAIQGSLARLGSDFSLLQRDLTTLGAHLRNANNKYDDVRRTAVTIEDKINRMSKPPSELEEQDVLVLPVPTDSPSSLRVDGPKR